MTDKMGDYVWDYASNKHVQEAKMPLGSKRWKKSELARWGTFAHGSQGPLWPLFRLVLAAHRALSRY